jgi:hypothetical protein
LLVTITAPVGAGSIEARLVRRCPSSPHQALLSEFCEWARVAGLIENNAALRHNFGMERIVQTDTKEVNIVGSSCRLYRHGTIRRKHSDERGRNFTT